MVIAERFGSGTDTRYKFCFFLGGLMASINNGLALESICQTAKLICELHVLRVINWACDY